MLVKKGIFICLLCMLPSVTQAITLQEAVNSVINTHPLVAERIKHYNSIVEDVNIAKAGYLPTLDLQAGTGFERINNSVTNFKWRDADIYQARVVLRENLFNGLGTKNDVTRNEARLAAAVFSLLARINQTAYDTVSAYIDILKLQDQTEEARKNVNTQQKIFLDVRKIVEQGVGKKSDLDRVAARLASAQSNYVLRDNSHKEAVYNFHKLLGRFVDQEALLVPRFDNQQLPLSLDEGLRIMFERHPSLQMAARNVEVQRAAYEYNKKDYFPKVDLELSHEWTQDMDGTDGRDDKSQAMIMMNWNLFNGQADRARVKKGLSLIHNENELKRNTQRDHVNDLQLIWSGYKLLKKQSKYLVQHKVLMRKILKSAHEEYRLGKKRLIGVLDAENEFYQATAQLIDAEYDLLLSKYRLLYSMGILCDYLQGVTLPVEFLTLRNTLRLKGLQPDTLPLDHERDGDGIPDDRDVCPVTLPGTMVRTQGCDETMTSQYLLDPLFGADKTTFSRKLVKNNDDLSLNKLAMNEIVVLDYINFKKNSLELSPDSTEIMRTIITQLKNFDHNAVLEIMVYSHDGADPLYNKILSVRRACNLRKVLISNGIALDSIIVFGKAITKPEGKPENYLELKVVDRFEHVLDNYESTINTLITFEPNSEQLTESAKHELQKYCRDIKTLGEIEVNIIVYSNELRLASQNRELCDRRAHEIDQFMKAHGIDRALTITFGAGGYNPLNYNIYDPEAPEATNMVELIVKKDLDYFDDNPSGTLTVVKTDRSAAEHTMQGMETDTTPAETGARKKPHRKTGDDDYPGKGDLKEDRDKTGTPEAGILKVDTRDETPAIQVADQKAQPDAGSKTSAAAMDTFKIKVLSGTGNLVSAIHMAKRLKRLGYRVDRADLAPTANFSNNTVYFAEGYQDVSRQLVRSLGGDARLKPLTWNSVFDLIIVSVD